MRVFLGLLAAAVVAVLSFSAYAWHPAIAPAEPPSRESFAPDLVRRGSVLAAIGNCASCHSAPGQPAFSGAVPIGTPFGTVYSSNITPDPQTGIGRWSEAAFRRAMREGLDREGRHLYPAFPYDHYTHVTDADDGALYAYFMTRQPASHVSPANTLVFPLGFRPLMAGWKLLFFHPGADPAAGDEDPELARGAYLVDGLGHCGACHTPRNLLGAEERDRALAGGMAEGWNAYALNAASPAPIPWTDETLAFYLAHGWQSVHGVSRGPMAAVTANLAAVPASDVGAMARSLVAGMSGGSRKADATALLPTAVSASAGSQAPVAGGDSGEGAAIYAGACASCHDAGRTLPYGGLALRLSSALHAPDPTNIVLVTLHGLAAAPGEASPIMPGFAGSLDDRQIAALLAYLRGPLAREAPWPDLPATVHKARTEPVKLFPSDGASAAPAQTAIRVAP